MNDDNSLIRIADVADNVVLQFNDGEELSQWIESEEAAWSWLDKSLRVQRAAHASSHMKKVLQDTRNLVGQYNSANVDRQQEQLLAQLRQHLSSHYVAKEIPLSGSPRGNFILSLRSSHSIEFAAAALGAIFGLPSGGSYLEQRASFLVSAFDEGVAKRTTTSNTSALKRLASDYRRAITETNEDRKRLVSDNEQHIGQLDQATTERLDEISKEASNFIETNENRIEAAIADFKEVERFYTEYMELNASFEYWNTKAEGHEGRANSNKWWLIGFAVLGSLAVITGLSYLTVWALSVATMGLPAAILLIIATIGLVGSTSVFWVARILTRLYLSEHHLGIDARERAIMAKTFVALTKENAVETADRAIVLAALFRPTADGIVKDDASPDFSIASLLSRQGSG